MKKDKGTRNLEEFGPIEVYTESGVFVRSFERFKTFWLKFQLYGQPRPKRKRGDLSYWRLVSFSFSYGDTPQTTKVIVKCQLTSRPNMGIMRCEMDFPYTLHQTVHFLVKVKDLLFLQHAAKVYFGSKIFKLNDYRYYSCRKTKEAAKSFDATRLMFERVRRDRAFFQENNNGD